MGEERVRLRWRRGATIGLTALALLAAARPAGAVTYVGLHGLTCDGAITEGAGMPERTSLHVALLDPASGRTLARGRVTTGASGSFEWRARVALSGMRELRAEVRRPGQARPLAWVEQSLARACPLASTGPQRTLPLVVVGLSSLTLGVLVLIAFAYQGRHVSPGGRHLAASDRTRPALRRRPGAAAQACWWSPLACSRSRRTSRSPSSPSAATPASTPATWPTPTTKALGLVDRSRRTSTSGRGPAALASRTRNRARRSTASA
jgi:hypothetical protein